MPTYRSITLSLVSQFDILTIPEYAPPIKTPGHDPFSSSDSVPPPTLIDPDRSLVSVYIPTYPASQFWLAYSISPPHPPRALYYFKLSLNGVHVVSWGCGEEDGFKGKTMFGLFNTGETWLGERGVEMRVLCFAGENSSGGARRTDRRTLDDVMEVRVYRSKRRKRIQPEMSQFGQTPGTEQTVSEGLRKNSISGISLVNAGLLHHKHPQRYYKYILLDPLDQPFATFRYYYRTWDELEHLGVTSPTPSTRTSSMGSQPEEVVDQSNPHQPPNIESADKIHLSSPDRTAKKHAEKTSNNSSLHHHPLTAPPPTPHFFFTPPQPRKALPPSPTKNLPGIYPRTPTPIPDQLDIRPAIIADNRSQFVELLRRTPSPIKKDGSEGEDTKGEGAREAEGAGRMKRMGSMGVLRHVIDSAVRRRGKSEP